MPTASFPRRLGEQGRGHLGGEALFAQGRGPGEIVRGKVVDRLEALEDGDVEEFGEGLRIHACQPIVPFAPADVRLPCRIPVPTHPVCSTDAAENPCGRLWGVTLLTARDIRDIAADIGLRPTKQKGQNFVINPNTVRSIVAAAGLEGRRTSSRSGPASARSRWASSRPATPSPPSRSTRSSPIACRRRSRPSPRRPPSASISWAPMRPRVTESPNPPEALVANLPYNVAVPVLLHFLETFPSLRTVLVMVQLEVAERLAAAPGSRTYGVPSVKAQWYGEVALAGRIGKNVFWPAPNIDSGLVRIDVTRTDRDPESRTRLFTLVDAAFAQRRKTLRAALAGWAAAQRAEEILVAAGIDPARAVRP